MIKFILKQFGYAPYWETRFDGCMAVEYMVMARIKTHYPNQTEEMYKNLLQ